MFNRQLAEKGLNLQAVFQIDLLPPAIRDALVSICAGIDQYQQLLLFAHGGNSLWRNLKGSMSNEGITAIQNPVDQYSVELVTRTFQTDYATIHYQLLYPGDIAVDLQSLGELAGWHHGSPFLVGINKEWGSWFAYRVLMLADSDFPVTSHRDLGNPCTDCLTQPCIAACPVSAISKQGFLLDKCIAYRKSDHSRCHSTCLAREACPVAGEHRYDREQIDYHYTQSLETIRR